MSNFYRDDGGKPLNGRKICLATTAYESPAYAYTFSIQKTREVMHKHGFPTSYMLLSGNCHVDDARNYIVNEFISSDCTDLVFLDADVAWEPESLVRLCKHDADIVGGVYPFRSDSQKAVENMPVIMYPGQVEPEENGLIEVAGLPTGFMRIRRHVIETLVSEANQYPKRHERTLIPILFERSFIPGDDPKIGGRLGGDLNFCKKWITHGGKVWADPEIRLGHVVKSVVYDSLGAALRRQGRETLRYVADRVRSGSYDPNLFSEARKAHPNPWGALEDVLTMCAITGKKADGPIIEAGSGLTSIILAASTRETVHCLEHDQRWANDMKSMAEEAGIGNIELHLCPIENGWYRLPENLPNQYALGLNDGPPRTKGSRMGFFDRFGDTKTIICDDADDPGYGDALSKWCQERGRRIDFVERSAIIR